MPDCTKCLNHQPNIDQTLSCGIAELNTIFNERQKEDFLYNNEIFALKIYLII